MSSENLSVALLAAIVELSASPSIGSELDSSELINNEGIEYYKSVQERLLYDSLHQWSDDRFRQQYGMCRCTHACICLLPYLLIFYFSL